MRAFTLIELLSSVAVIAVLLGILMPVLTGVRCLGKRLVCQNNLRQIYLGWDLYLGDHDDRFLQGKNTNLEFGGWQGESFYSPHRPLNPYLELPVDMNTPLGTEIFRCPADTGGMLGVKPFWKAYHYYGNSYQTNLFLVGQTQTHSPGPQWTPLHDAINLKMEGLKRSQTQHHDKLAFVGDTHWLYEWMPSYPHREGWHGKDDYHNLAFLDGHVDFVKIRKGLYVSSDYHLVPFSTLFSLAGRVQKEESL